MGKPEPVTLAPAARASMPNASPASPWGRTPPPPGPGERREARLARGQLRGEGLDAGAHGRPALAQGGCLRAPGIGTGLDRLADLLRDLVPLGLQPVGFAQQPSSPLIESHRGVDRGGVFALVERALS